MSIRLHILARWYEARSDRAKRKMETLRAKAERIWRLLGARAGE